MQSERIYLVWAHPRHDSLTAHIADAIHQRAMERKIQVTELDLYRRNFNPVMTSEDEPDWKNMDKRYSPEVHQLYSELLEHDTLVVVFPLWWYSFPAMLKGYIDRVWNNGLGNVEKIELLPYHELGKHKWVAMGEEYKLDGVKPPKKETMERVKGILEQYGHKVTDQPGTTT